MYEDYSIPVRAVACHILCDSNHDISPDRQIVAGFRRGVNGILCGKAIADLPYAVLGDSACETSLQIDSDIRKPIVNSSILTVGLLSQPPTESKSNALKEKENQNHDNRNDNNRSSSSYHGIRRQGKCRGYKCY